MAAPVWAGAGAFTSGVGALTVPVPAGYAAGDTFLLFINSANQTIATPAGGWTEVANSPQGTGTAAAAGGTALAVFYKITGASESDVSVADSGSYTTAQIHLITGCPDSNPIHLTAGGVQASASTDLTLPSLTTTINDALIFLAIGLDNNGNSTANVTSWTNADLWTITEQTDQTVNAGAGGGLGIATATMDTDGATGTTAVVTATAKTAAFMTIALRPKVQLDADGNSASTALAALTTVPVGAELVDSQTGTDTITTASWVAAGDIALVMAFRDGSATPPSLASGCTSLDSSGSGTSSSVLAYKVLTAGGVQDIGPFTNATSVACNVYRDADPGSPVGNWAISTGTGTTVTLPAVTTNPDDFVVGFAGHQSVDVTWPASATGVVQRDFQTDATDSIVVYDSAGAVP